MKTSFLSPLLLAAGVLIAITATAQPELIWEKNFNLRSGGYAHHIFYEPEDGNLLVSGVISQFDGDEGYGDQSFPIIMRLGADGEPVWIHEGTPTKIADSPLITRCDWGGYLIVGATKETEEQTPYSLTAKNIDIETGDVAWERTYPTDSLTSVRAISAWNIQNGRMLIFGWTHPAQYLVEPTHDDLFIMEISTETGECFSTTYIQGTERVTLTHVQRIYDGGFILVGKVGEPEPLHEGKAFIARINSNYEPVMWQIFEGEGDDNVTGLAPHPGGFYLLCSNYDVNLEMEQSYLINMNLNGEVIWRHSIGGDDQTAGYAISLSDEGNIWVAGRCIPRGEFGPDKSWLAEVNSDGELLWQQNLSGENYGTAYGLASTRNGGVYVACAGPTVMYLASEAQNVSYPESTNHPVKLSINGAAPNPFNSETIVTFEAPVAGSILLSLADASGRTIRTWSQNIPGTGMFTASIDAGDLVAGAYWLRLKQGESEVVGRVVLIR